MHALPSLWHPNECVPSFSVLRLCSFGESIFQKAKDAQLSGDEEQSYILFTTYLNVVEAVMKSEEYMYADGNKVILAQFAFYNFYIAVSYKRLLPRKRLYHMFFQVSKLFH